MQTNTAPAAADAPPLLEARNVSKYFGAVIAIEGVSLAVRAGEINCLLGDNGAGKSTLIKMLSGVHTPDEGTLAVDGTPVRFGAPRDALDAGIATVYQDLSVMPLMSISRNFFLGNEPTKGFAPFKRFDSDRAARIAREEMKNIGIEVRDTEQLVGTLSGGERQTLAIARAEYFGARVLILDEPTSALGVKESAIVLRHAIAARNKGLGVVFITHNVQHALPIGDSFTILTRGRSGGTFKRGELNAEELHRLMGGGSELEELQADLEILARREARGEEIPTVPLGEPTRATSSKTPNRSRDRRMAATIGDVAERAHVSTATVSRVLAGVGRARPETEARVLAAARELDYRPSGIARSLKRQTTETLGLIVTDIENPYFPELVRAVEDAARAEGYAILLCNAADDPEREAGYLELLVERRVDGLIIAASSLGARHSEWLAAAPLPVVLVNTTAADVDLPSIHSDNRAGSRLAAQHLLDLGHRRFGYLMPPPRNVDGPVRLAGVRDALAGTGLDPASIAIATGAPLVGGGEAAMLELLDRGPDVTAVLAYNDLMAIGALRAVRRRGGSVPGDVSVVGFDDVALAAYVDPPLTTLSQSTAEMGYWAVARLAERLRSRAPATDAHDGTGSAPSVMLPVRLEVRGSTGPPRLFDA